MTRIRLAAVVAFTVSIIPAFALAGPPTKPIARPVEAAVPLPRPLDSPVSANGCEDGAGACIVIPDGRERFCKCRLDKRGTADSDPAAQLTVMRGTETVQRWAAESFLGAIDDFRVYRVPGRGDSASYLVVNGEGIGNGLAPSVWSCAQLNGADLAAPPVLFVVHDFHPSIVTGRAGGAVSILATAWQPDTDAAHGSGFYFFGRPFALDPAELMPLWEQPSVRRRLLNPFLHELSRRGPMNEKGEIPNEPLRWLRAGSTESIEADPWLHGRNAKTIVSGTIRSVKVRRENEGRPIFAELALTMEDSNGEAHLFHYGTCPLCLGNADDPDDGERIDVLAERGPHDAIRVYPERYLPSDPARWSGKRAEVASYTGDLAAVTALVLSRSE